MMEMDPTPSSNDCCPTLPGRRVDPTLRGISDRFFVNIRSETYRCVRVREVDMLAVPWGPRLDIMFDPKGAPGIVGGKVRIMARTAGAEVEISNTIILSPDQPITVSVATGCDEYVVKAQLGTDPGPNARTVESYFFARVYGTH